MSERSRCPLARRPPRPRSASRPRRYPRLLEAGVFAAATAACGGDVAGAAQRYDPDPDPMIAGGIAEPFGSGGLATGGTNPSGGTTVGTLGGTVASGGGEVDGGAPMPFTGGSGGASAGGQAGEGGSSVVGVGGVGSGGAASPWDGWTTVHVVQSTPCVGAGQPLDVEVVAGPEGATLVATGTRTVAAPEGTEDCLPNCEEDICSVAEPFAVVLSEAPAQEVLAAFSYLPEATCNNDLGVECEMPCSAPALEIDGVSRGSVFCCGTFDNPAYAERARAATALLMDRVDAQIASGFN